MKDEEGNSNYAALLCRMDNPNLEAVAQEFVRTANMFNNKP